MSAEKTIVIVTSDKNDGKLTFELPPDIEEEINALSESDRRAYLREIQITLTQVARTLSTLTINRSVFLSQQESFHQKLRQIRLSCAKAPFIERKYYFEA